MSVRKLIAFTLFIAGYFFISGAKAEVAVPELTAAVIDQTNTLTSEQQASLRETLLRFEKQKGSQIAVLIVPTTEPETIEQYALRVVEKWKLGRKKIDDGVLLLVAKSDRALRIEVGYGLEGALNDATSKRIISETIVPFFKQGEFYQGINAGVNQIVQVLMGEPLPAPSRYSYKENKGYGTEVIILIVLVVGGILRALIGPLLGALVTAGGAVVTTWFLGQSLLLICVSGIAAFLIVLSGIGPLGLGGGRGGSGGGFSGGGGGFGGGGASGRW